MTLELDAATDEEEQEAGDDDEEEYDKEGTDDRQEKPWP